MAELPAHRPASILLIGDEVNPHGLADADLTQPADIAAALEASGLELDVTLVDSQCVDDALTLLPTVDVVVYFAHKSAHACAGADRQPQLTSALEAHLVRGGGVVVYHHGLYVDSGKEAVLELLGAQAGSVAWDTTDGQRVIATAPGHFVVENGTSYTGTATLAAGNGAPAGTFASFVNVPDERYPTTSLLVEAGESRQILFASDSGGTRVLGYDLSRPGWSGRVVAYQPAEYQPAALADDGVNFQILVNAIYHSTDLSPAATTPDAGTVPSTPDAMTATPATPEESGGGCGVAPGGSGLVAVLALLSLVAWLRRAP
jgi:hypothetical protein